MQPHDFWQELLPPTRSGENTYTDAYPARLADGRRLLLPIRPLGTGETGLASLIINQASFAVTRALAADLARQLTPLKPDILVGMPTLGLTLAGAVAEALGHSRYVPLGTSRKFWYEERLSVPISSITTPQQEKQLYIDPRMMPLLENRRVVLVDDVISSGRSIVAGLTLLDKCAINPVAIATAMLQTDRHCEVLSPFKGSVIAALSSPLLAHTPDGFWRSA